MDQALYNSGSKTRMDRRARTTFTVAIVLLAAFFISLWVRKVGSFYTPVDGWGTSLFEFASGLFCLYRYFDPNWRQNVTVGRSFPLFVGLGSIAWSLGDILLTGLTAAGMNISPPSAVDALYIWFFPLCYIGMAALLRKEAGRATGLVWLDRLIAILGVGTIFAAFVIHPVLNVVGGISASSLTSMAYPTGDLLLLAVALSGLVVVPKDRRKVLIMMASAVAINAIGDTYNLLQPNSRLGYVSNAAAWPISLLVLSMAAWSQISQPSKLLPSKSGGFVLPAVGGIAALVILGIASMIHIGGGAIGFATITLIATGYRLTLTVRRAQVENETRQHATEEREAVLVELLGEVAGNAEMLAGSSDRLTKTASQLSKGADVASSQADVAAATSEAISTNTRSVAASAQEMAASITEITRSTAEALTVGVEARRASEETSVTISKLADSSNQIGKVLGVITSIAQQTNLLALNATIEAARAGEAGKGFAVVANEVKELATETAKATDEIGSMIQAIQRDTRYSVDAIEHIAQTIGKINDLQTVIAASVEQQSSATAQVIMNVHQVSESSEAVSYHIGTAAEAARGTAGGSSDALAAASELSLMASSLRSLVSEHNDLLHA